LSLVLIVFPSLLISPGCKRGNSLGSGEVAYISAPQVNLRDRLSAVYNKTGLVKNGERVTVLEKNKHFVRVRTSRGEEGWIETRYLASAELYSALEQLARENVSTPVQAHGATRAELKMHVTPGRDTDALFRIEEGGTVEVLKRSTAPRPDAATAGASRPAHQRPDGARPTEGPNPGHQPARGGEAGVQTPPLEDWWLVRDTQGRTGWVLARMVDIDIPTDVAQYAEGQRIVADFVLNQVSDVNPENGQTRMMAQYLIAANDPKDGTPWDYNQVRVFTWNARRHRYETAYRERNLYGVLPVTVAHEVFDREGDLPTFTLRLKDSQGNILERKYKFE
jgi:SH3-like domain-containing protein